MSVSYSAPGGRQVWSGRGSRHRLALGPRPSSALPHLAGGSPRAPRVPGPVLARASGSESPHLAFVSQAEPQPPLWGPNRTALGPIQAAVRARWTQEEEMGSENRGEAVGRKERTETQGFEKMVFKAVYTLLDAKGYSRIILDFSGH